MLCWILGVWALGLGCGYGFSGFLIFVVLGVESVDSGRVCGFLFGGLVVVVLVRDFETRILRVVSGCLLGGFGLAVVLCVSVER